MSLVPRREIANRNSFNNSDEQYDDPQRVPTRSYRRAIKNPYFKKMLKELSILEDEENSYYTGILNTISEHCVGSVPLIMGNHENNLVNDKVEDKWLEWAINNKIGSILRQVRRGAARTGLGIAIPYHKEDPNDPIGIGLKTVSSLRLTNPIGSSAQDRIYDGVEYDENWDMVKIYIRNEESFIRSNIEPLEYNVKDIIIWFKDIHEDMVTGVPECGPAFCLFPSVKRFMKAIVTGEEFRASMPMAVELDSSVYTPEDANLDQGSKFKYEPGIVPTLPPGTKLVGMPISGIAQERTEFIRLVIGAAARCIQMPMNIALGDSSGHNMATAAIDIQPWINRVKIDRVDFQPPTRKVIKWWYDRAILVSNYLPPQARTGFSYDLNYDATFEHPDPGKRANARAVDLASGSTTLHKVYTDQALNPRRQLDREARLLGITRDELNTAILVARTKVTALLEPPEEENEESTKTKKKSSDKT